MDKLYNTLPNGNPCADPFWWEKGGGEAQAEAFKWVSVYKTFCF